MLLEQIHNTHVLSSLNSSSNDHTYEFENNNKNEKKLISPTNNKENLVIERFSNYHKDKINEILNKYNIMPDRSSNKEEKNILKYKKGTINGDSQLSLKLKKKKNVQLKKKDFNGNNSLSKFNSISNSNNTIINKEKTENKIEEQKCDDINYNKFPETTRNNNNKNFLSYKNSIGKTRFNNISKFLEVETKSQQRKKNNKSNRLLIYQQTNNPRNLLRSIKKPEISFFTKFYKSSSITTNYDIFSDLRLSVKNNICFYTKKFVKKEEYAEIEKKMKKEIFVKLKKEIEEENIPSFSSIKTSSSNNSTKLKIKPKAKSKSKGKKKINKHKTTKPKLPKKKRLKLYKNNKSMRSTSVHSKFSNESNKTRLTRKLSNMKSTNTKLKNQINEKNKEINQETRKYSVITKIQERFSNKRKISINNKIASSSSLRNVNNYKSPFNNNLLNINKISDDENYDKDKENREKDFKRFLEEQRIKRNNQIRNFMKKKGMNSYNFFYPKEPSPLLSVFKNKYSVYPTLNMNRRSSLEKQEKKQTKEMNKTNYISTSRHEKKSMKKILEEKEKEKRKEISKLHVIEKHYGNEKDCPICRLFEFKRKKEEINNNYIKSFKYDKLKIFEKNSGLLGLSPQNGMRIMKEFEPMSRNRLNSARIDLILTDSQKKKNFNALFEYLLL